MQDLTHSIVVPKMQVTEGFPVLPDSVMSGFSDQETTTQAADMIGLHPNEPKEAGENAGLESSLRRHR